VDISFKTYCLCVFVCLFVCLFVRLRISPPLIKLAASNFARRFVGNKGRESPILGNFAPPEAQHRTNWPGRIARVTRAMAAKRAIKCVVCAHVAGGRNSYSLLAIFYGRPFHRVELFFFCSFVFFIRPLISEMSHDQRNCCECLSHGAAL